MKGELLERGFLGRARPWFAWAAIFGLVMVVIPNVAAHYNKQLDSYLSNAEWARKMGILDLGQLEPYTVDVKVYPQNSTLALKSSDGVCRGSTDDPNMPCEQQLVAAVLLTDGTVWCSDGGYNNEPADTADRITMAPWVLGDCYEAVALLDTVVIQDTTYRAIRLQWASQVGAERLIIAGPDTTRIPYDSVRYNVTIRSPDLIVFDSIFADTAYIWQGGTFGQQYFAQGTACGHLGGAITCAGAGPELPIIFPYPEVIETTIVPMQILADTVTIQ